MYTHNMTKIDQLLAEQLKENNLSVQLIETDISNLKKDQSMIITAIRAVSIF